MKRPEKTRGVALRGMVIRALELGTKRHGFSMLRPGVQIRPLAGNPNKGPSAALLRYAKGASIPAHRHHGFEIIYVLEGSQSDEGGTYEAGSLVVNNAGDEHSVRSEQGCLVLVVWERPIQFL